MKSEPLKGKLDCLYKADKNEIRSAAEWLKEKVISNYPLNKTQVIKFINEAFEDVFS